MNTANDGMTMEVRREWRKTKKGCWTMTLRLGTTSVRVTQRTPDGPFCRILYVKGASDCDGSSDGHQSWASLRTTDKALAQARAEAFLRALIQVMRADETLPDPPSAAATTTVAPSSAVQEVTARRALDVEQLVNLFMEAPRFPVATDERFQKTLAAIDRLVAETTNETLKLQYRMLRLAILSLDGTGRRISAILGLRWCDIVVLEENGVRQPQIHFVRSLDKADRGAWLPLAQAVYDEFMEWKKYCPPSAAGLVFPGVSNAIAVRSDWMGELLGRAEVVAGLAPLNGSLFHAYRRRFATAREHVPFNRVMELMGITDAKVFRECYCRTSSDSLREALDSPRPVTDPRLELAA